MLYIHIYRAWRFVPREGVRISMVAVVSILQTRESNAQRDRSKVQLS